MLRNIRHGTPLYGDDRKNEVLSKSRLEAFNYVSRHVGSVTWSNELVYMYIYIMEYYPRTFP